MATTSAATEACMVCKQTFHSAELLYGTGGMICAMCEGDQRMEASFRRGLWTTVFGGPAMAFTGSMFLFASVLIGGLGPIFMMVCGAAALLGAFRCLMTAWSLSTPDAEREVSPVAKVALLVSGLVSLLWGGGLALFGAVLFAIWMWSW